MDQERIKEVAPKAIVLSGGPNSVHLADAPQLSPGFFEYCTANSIPVLGICYGMQLLVHVRALPSGGVNLVHLKETRQRDKALLLCNKFMVWCATVKV